MENIYKDELYLSHHKISGCSSANWDPNPPSKSHTHDDTKDTLSVGRGDIPEDKHYRYNFSNKTNKQTRLILYGRHFFIFKALVKKINFNYKISCL